MEMPETMRHKGEMMGTEGRDQFLEEVDQALRSINARLKKAFLKTEVLLKEHFKERPATQESDDEETREG
jgi:truncated hemoglobin YjbI